MVPRIILLAVFLSACDDEADDDTSPDTDADTDADTDTDTDTDVDADLTFEIEGGIDSTVLTLNWFSPGPGEPAFDHPPLAALAVTSSSQGVAVTEPPSTDLVELDPKQWPGFQVAMYLPALHEDLDADRHHDEVEFWVGVGQVFPTWVAGTIPAEFSKMGLVEGWNAVLPGLSGFETDATLYPVTGIPLAAHLWPGLPITFGGTVEIAGDPSQMGLVALDMANWKNLLAESFPLTDPWALTMDERYPEDSVVWSEYDVGVGSGLLAALTDVDGSGGYSTKDMLAGWICNDFELIGIGWVEPPTDLFAAWYTDLLMGFAGWAPVTIDLYAGGFEPVDPADWTNLQISMDCSPW